MLVSVVVISLFTSIFLFKIGIAWAALLPLLVSMYLIFTDGRIDKNKKDWQFSKYHILFGLWCLIIIGIALLLHTFGIWMLTILLIILWFHIGLIWLTLIGWYKDEFTMFHIGYYFVALIIARYIPIQYGFQYWITTLLLFPIVTFLLYAWGSFFIHPFVPLPDEWHYRTGIFFFISFLSSTILYFFSAPLIGRGLWLVFYTIVIWFIAYQYKAFIRHEREKIVYAEDILAGEKVIKPGDTWQNKMQWKIHHAMSNLPYTWRSFLVRGGVIFLIGMFVSSFSVSNEISGGITFLLLCFWAFLYYDSLKQRESINYPVYWELTTFWWVVHAIFIWSIRKFVWFDDLITSTLLTMWRTLVSLWTAIFAANQLFLRKDKKKKPLLYGYVFSSILVSIGLASFFPKLLENATFTTGMTLLYLWIIGIMVYFFFQAMEWRQPTRKPKTQE